MPGPILLYSRSMLPAHAWLAAVLGLAPALPGGPPQRISAGQEFHGADTRLIPSPDGTRRVRIRSFAATLEGKGIRGSRLLARIQRSGSLLWSADGSLIALNDDMGSNCADAYVFDARRGRRLVDLEEAIDRGFPEDVWMGHRYVRITGWNGPRCVDVLVEGHAESWGMAFEMRYQYTLGKGLVRISRMREGPKEDSLKPFTEPCPKG